jgi:transposase
MWRNGQAYGDDLRQRVLAAQGSTRQVAQRFDVSPMYVSSVRRSYERSGAVHAAAQCNHQRLCLEQPAGLKEQLLAHIAQVLQASLGQLCAWVQQRAGLRVGVTCMHKTLKRWGLTHKKRPYRPVSSNAAMYKRPANTGRHTKPIGPMRGWCF